MPTTGADEPSPEQETQAGEGSVFFYVMLTLVFILTVIALIFAIIAYVKATSQRVGPAGPQGPAGIVSPFTLFEQPAMYVSQVVYTIMSNPDPVVQPRFLVFTGVPSGKNPIEVTMPDAKLFNGKIFRFYNVQAVGGVLLKTAFGNSITPAIFNPILPGYFAMVISDGASEWIINSSTIETVITSGTS